MQDETGQELRARVAELEAALSLAMDDLGLSGYGFQFAPPFQCGPWTCPYPKPATVGRGTRWTCPDCGTTYRMTGRKRSLPWRNWCAPHGHWVLPWWGRR